MPTFNINPSLSTTITRPAVTTSITTRMSTTQNVTSVLNSTVTSTSQAPLPITGFSLYYGASTSSSSFSVNSLQNNFAAASSSTASSPVLQLDSTTTTGSSTTQKIPVATFAPPYLFNTLRVTAHKSPKQESVASTSQGNGTSSSRFFGPVLASRTLPGLRQSARFGLWKRQKIDRAIHLPLPVANTVSSNPPLPPNWNANIQQVLQSLDSYKLFRVNSTTFEFHKLTKLLDPLVVQEIEQIVNPSVWTRFINARKEMLKAKCDYPLTLLKELGLSDGEIERKQQSLNFGRHNAIDASPYSDNFTILFHCTKDMENVESILRDGLDERMANGGFLGRGIYFADKSQKSVGYDGCKGVIFICGVLLGDCLTTDRVVDSGSLTTGPEKCSGEKRNIADNYFDSVFRSGECNEYAVFNRYQCCPLYRVKYLYKPDYAVSSPGKNINPPFAWLYNHPHNKENSKKLLDEWPLNAKTIFDEIEATKGLEPILRHQPTLPPIVPTLESIDEKLLFLKNFGYTDIELNLKMLKENDYNIETCIRLLLQKNIDALVEANSLAESRSESDSEGSSYHSSSDEDEPMEGPTNSKNSPRTHSKCKYSTRKDSPRTDSSRKAIISLRSIKPVVEEEDCLICCNTYAKTSNNWKTLQCEHKLCLECFKKIEITRTTMTGVTHTFVKCAFCLRTTGIEIGICPNGVMNEKTIESHCDGYEDCYTIVIEYKVKTAGYRKLFTNRVAFLPNNDEGLRILKLLRIAWDRRISFTIGTSHTTGVENTLVWNIHHKTSRTGGVYCYGYPDPTYFERVTAELKGYGIE